MTKEDFKKLEQRLSAVELYLPGLTEKVNKFDIDQDFYKNLLSSILHRLDRLEHPDLQPSVQAFNELRKRLAVV